MSSSRQSSHSRSQSVRQPQFNHREGLLYPEGSVLPEDTVRLLHEAEGRASPVPPDDEPEEHELWHMLPWWKRPSAIWMLFIVPFTVIAMAGTIAPKVEVYTTLVCQVFKPEYTTDMVPFSTAATTSTGSYSQCAADPVVLKEVARLQTIITATMGILSCLTAGWWGLYSDCKGRTRVLGVTVWGLLFNDVLLIFVAKCAQLLPGNYWWLVLGSVAEGVLGGTPGGLAAVHAYVADTTEPSHRSRIFALSLGLTFTGMALGPSIGSVLIRLSHKTISVFYMSTAIHFTYALMMWFIVPESLTKARMRRSLELYHKEQESARNAERGLSYYTKKLFGFLAPLAVFAPMGSSTLSKSRLDWTLTLVVLAFAFNIILQASYPFKFQYAAAAFGWSSEILGYWLSLIGAIRAIYLAFVLPVIIRVLKKPSRTLEVGNRSQSRSPGRVDTHSSAFDLGLSKASLCADLVAYILMGSIAHKYAFTGGAVMASLGSGFSPAIQAVALDVYAQHGGTESGRLFAGLSVIQAMFSQVVGPSLFGLIFMNTAATFPRAIFFFCALMNIISLLSLAFVRLRKGTATNVEAPLTEEEPLLTRD